MNLKDVGEFISRMGFPVAVAVYLLVRFDSLLRENTQAILALKIFLEANLTK